jgi:hypothetical protein
LKFVGEFTGHSGIEAGEMIREKQLIALAEHDARNRLR